MPLKDLSPGLDGGLVGTRLRALDAGDKVDSEQLGSEGWPSVKLPSITGGWHEVNCLSLSQHSGGE